LAEATKWTFTTTAIQKPTGTFQPPKDTAGVYEPPTGTADTTFRVVMSAPSDGADGVPITSSIIVSFSKPVQPTTLSTATFKLTTIDVQYQGTPPFAIPIPVVINVAGTVTISTDGKSAMFDPAQLLVAKKTYSYTLTGIKDLSGNSVVPNPNFGGSFTTS
jgi:hypothetical protein